MEAAVRYGSFWRWWQPGRREARSRPPAREAVQPASLPDPRPRRQSALHPARAPSVLPDEDRYGKGRTMTFTRFHPDLLAIVLTAGVCTAQTAPPSTFCLTPRAGF